MASAEGVSYLILISSIILILNAASISTFLFWLVERTVSSICCHSWRIPHKTPRWPDYIRLPCALRLRGNNSYDYPASQPKARQEVSHVWPPLWILHGTKCNHDYAACLVHPRDEHSRCNCSPNLRRCRCHFTFHCQSDLCSTDSPGVSSQLGMGTVVFVVFQDLLRLNHHDDDRRHFLYSSIVLYA